ncbi:MipA/OmpV family protein [Salinimonas sediminis]|uniref:MipA/OmpV family protein n=1 Tax=Salinimonas sediminis TaxID=2303538 RepID=UPI0014764297|nr:MipA/OmpV family protein [Salinimonas sediminis]
MYRFTWLFLAVAACYVGAAEDSASYSQPTPATAWQLGIAAGHGQVSSPVRGAANRSLWLIADVAWYGSTFYLDNTEAGGFIWDSADKRGSAQAYVTYNREAQLFDNHAISDITVPFLPFNSAARPASTPDVQAQQLASRHYAVHAGARLVYEYAASRVSFSIERDISGTHDGYLATAGYQMQLPVPYWQVSATAMVSWYSQHFNQYYYGIDNRDNVSPQYHYRPAGGFRPALDITATHALSPAWGVVVFARYTALSDTVTDSPVVDKNGIFSAYAGLSYHF